MVDAPTCRVDWPVYYRLINSAYPPIDLFEDIADPADWILLGSAESKTNARLSETVGCLDLIPEDRRVGGAGASYVMAPFTHMSPDRPGRFHDGTFGAFYGANTFETALAETIHHTAIYCDATEEEAGWIADKRELTGRIEAEMLDIRTGYEALLAPDNYGASQAFARDARAEAANGLLYPSVRNPSGLCFAAFFPDVMERPKQARHFSYHWNGVRVDQIKDLASGDVYAIEDV
jgi:hypothetical protein